MPTDRRTILKSSLAVAAAAAIPAKASVPERPLAGKSVLITGCSSGFGNLAARHFAELGAQVFATMRNFPRPEASELAAWGAAGAVNGDIDLRVLEIDVTSEAQVVDGVAEAERIAGGGIDILVNNAGIGITSPVEIQDMEATQLIFDTNVFGIQRMIRAVLPGMRAKKSGLIVNISSQLGRVIVPASGHYSATKFAVEAMSEQLAYELVPHGIDVSIIQPGGYPTKVWVNRNHYTKTLKDRTDGGLIAAYGPMAARMGEEDGSGRTADPMDVPRAIAEIAMMEPGKRPLRRAVHPGPKPQEEINRVSAETQVSWLGETGYGMLVKAVHD